jgi:hypothetical protein
MLDLVSLDNAGAIRRASLGRDGWSEASMAAWPELATGAAAGSARLFLADLDNNGALDVVASSPAGTATWLAGEDYTLTRLAGRNRNA